jgi:hypothetical protein
LDGNGALESAEFSKVLAGAMPTASLAELAELLRRYAGEGRSGQVPLAAAVARMAAVAARGGGGRAANAAWGAAHASDAAPPPLLLPPPPQQQRHEGPARGLAVADGGGAATSAAGAAQVARRLAALEDDVVQRLKTKMKNDNPLELRRVLKGLVRSRAGVLACCRCRSFSLSLSIFFQKEKGAIAHGITLRSNDRRARRNFVLNYIFAPFRFPTTPYFAVPSTPPPPAAVLSRFGRWTRIRTWSWGTANSSSACGCSSTPIPATQTPRLRRVASRRSGCVCVGC